jgi:hypothetical protein
VSEIALSPDPITAERVTSVLSSRALYGGKLGVGVGAGLPVLGAAADKGLRAARSAVEKGPELLTGTLSALPGSSRLQGVVIAPLANAGKKAVKKTQGAIDAVTGAAEKAAPIVPFIRPTALKVLQSVSYSPDIIDAEESRVTSELHSAYRSRELELLSVTEPGLTRPIVRPRARQQIADRLLPIRAASPLLADRIESIAVRRLEYLAGELPRRPSVVALNTGPDTWRPSNMAMGAFARKTAAVEFPITVFERALDGTVTPEDASALKAVYPSLWEEARIETMMLLSGRRSPLPYQRRLALSILYGQPLDPSLDPKILAILQQSFASEPGTAGGTEAPTIKPRFGAIEKPEPTPAQDRATG